jgi:hypothetical protein
MDADPVRLVVSPDDGRLAAEVLARAFHADPPVVHFIPDPVRRAAVMPEFFERFVRHGQLFGEVHGPAARLEAIAIWLPPGRTDVTPERARRSGLDTLVDVFDGESFARLSAFLAQTADLHQRAMPGPHWYLAFIGVDPAAQGRGLGGAPDRSRARPGPTGGHGLLPRDVSGAHRAVLSAARLHDRGRGPAARVGPGVLDDAAGSFGRRREE